MKNFIKAFLITIGLSVSYKVVAGSKGAAVVYSAIFNSPLLLMFSIVGLYLFLRNKEKISYPTNYVQKLVSVFFAYCTWCLTVYNSGIETIEVLISNNIIGLIFSGITLISYFFVLDSIQGILTYYYSEKISIYRMESKFSRKFITLFERNPFKISLLVILCFWLLVAITSYPSVFMGDSLDQVEQFLGYQTRTAAHPVLSTIFIGSFVKLGGLIGSANLGLFFYTMSQLIIVSICISYSIKLVYDMTGKSNLLLFIVFLFGILPSINGTVVLATKDIVFAGFFVLYSTTLAIYFLKEKLFFKQKIWLLYGISILMMMLFRYNTIHFVLLSVTVYFVGELIGRKKIFRKNSLILLTVLSILIGLGVNQLLVTNFAEENLKPKRREMLSLPFQQTARYIKYYEEEITESEKEIINNVLDYDVIKEAYVPTRSDAVKRTHNEGATSEEMSAYYFLVLKQTIKHPIVALESVTVSHGNLFNVGQTVNWYYKNSVILEENQNGMMERYEKVQLSDKKIFVKMNKVRIFFYFLWDRLPIFSQLNNYGVYIFLFISLFVLALRRKEYKVAAIFIPGGSFLGTLIAGPITQGYLRYELPIILITPILFILFFYTKDIDKKNVNEGANNKFY